MLVVVDLRRSRWSLALALIPLGLVGFEYIPPVDRGADLPDDDLSRRGTPLETTRRGLLAVESAIDDIARRASRVVDGRRVPRPAQRLHQQRRGRADEHLPARQARRTRRRTGPTASSERAKRIAPGATIVSVPATDIAGGNAQPIDEVVSSVDGMPEPYARKVAAALAATPGAIDVTTSAADDAPQVERASSTATARARSTRASAPRRPPCARRSAAISRRSSPARTASRTCWSPIRNRRRRRSPRSSRSRSAPATVRSCTSATSRQLVQAPAPPMIMRINRQSVVYVGANIAPGATLSNVQRAFAAAPARAATCRRRVTVAAGGRRQPAGRRRHGHRDERSRCCSRSRSSIC